MNRYISLRLIVVVYCIVVCLASYYYSNYFLFFRFFGRRIQPKFHTFAVTFLGFPFFLRHFRSNKLGFFYFVNKACYMYTIVQKTEERQVMCGLYDQLLIVNIEWSMAECRLYTININATSYCTTELNSIGSRYTISKYVARSWCSAK